MLALKIPHNTYVLVGDGAKALLLRNEGDEVYPNLVTTDVLTNAPNPRTAAQGTDRPGHFQDGGTGRRSSAEPTDWHVLAEHRFAQEIAGAVETLNRSGSLTKLIVVAPARTLADLRKALSRDVHGKIIAEVDKDLTHAPVYKIEQLLTGTT